MSSDAFKTAQELIKQKRYDEARTLLRTLDHPLAPAWLESLQGLGSDAPAARSRRPWLLVVVALLIIAGIGLGIYLLYQNQQMQLVSEAQRLMPVNTCVEQGNNPVDCANQPAPPPVQRYQPTPGSFFPLTPRR